MNRMFVRMTAAASVGAALAAGGMLATGQAHAYPWYYGTCIGGTSIQTPWGGYCDGPPVDQAGDHWHCESAPFYSGCMWKDAGNITIAAPPGLGY